MTRVRALSAAAVLLLLPALSRADSFHVTPLVADFQNGVTQPLGFGAPFNVDPQLVNPWGVSFGKGGPFWVSNNGSGFSTLYNGLGVKQGLVVQMPGNSPGSPVPITGQVNNGTAGFNKDIFIFAGENGAVYGWRGNLGTVAETLKSPSDPNTGDVYKGLALNGTTLIAANFRTGKLDAFNGSIASFSNPTADPNLPAGFAPFNVATLNGKTFVTFAKQDPASGGSSDLAGPGNGLIDVVDASGNFLSRLVTGGVLNSPWGMAIAPASFGRFAGDLLVGNFGDGEINVFDPNTGAFLGTLLGPDGNPLMIPGLWDLTVGSGSATAPTSRLFFTAGAPGPNGDGVTPESDGIFGTIDPVVPEPGSLGLFLVGGAGLWLARRLRARPASGVAGGGDTGNSHRDAARAARARLAARTPPPAADRPRRAPSSPPPTRPDSPATPAPP
jgi:uncharacterized protein (TIGR03118 family)